MRDPAPPDFASSLGLNPFQAQLLYNRGITDRARADAFLSDGSGQFHDPLLLPDMREAVSRLVAAVERRETVAIFGDFDTDGLTATALLVTALRELGLTTVPYLPDRVDEGHGLNPLAVGAIRAQGVSLMVTVDCGSSSVSEVELASSLGMDTIITDHHSLNGPAPQVEALVNPSRPDSRYPYDSLTGAGLSFKLVQALWDALGRPPPEELVELAAIGTIADVAPLTGENRDLVRRGLERINRTRSPGLRALMSVAGLEPGALDSESLSFGIIPRLNAAGRLGHASLSLDLLTATSMEAATPIAERLETLNDRRRQLTKQNIAQALAQVEPQANGTPAMVMVESEDWEPGILGLIANNLSDAYYRPAVAVSVGPDISRASARSIEEFNVVEALHGCRDLFHRYGGHPRAAGFTVSTRDLPAVRSRLTEAARRALDGSELRPSIDIECEVSPTQLDRDNYAFVESLRPYGEGNPDPVFLTRGAVVTRARRVGRRRDHLKMALSEGGRSWDAIAFKLGERAVKQGDRVDVVYNAGLNTWGGVTSMELKVLDFRRAGVGGG